METGVEVPLCDGGVGMSIGPHHPDEAQGCLTMHARYLPSTGGVVSTLPDERAQAASLWWSALASTFP